MHHTELLATLHILFQYSVIARTLPVLRKFILAILTWHSSAQKERLHVSGTCAKRI